MMTMARDTLRFHMLLLLLLLSLLLPAMMTVIAGEADGVSAMEVARLEAAEARHMPARGMGEPAVATNDVAAAAAAAAAAHTRKWTNDEQMMMRSKKPLLLLDGTAAADDAVETVMAESSTMTSMPTAADDGAY